jgi:hypothetical protein
MFLVVTLHYSTKIVPLSIKKLALYLVFIRGSVTWSVDGKQRETGPMACKQANTSQHMSSLLGPLSIACFIREPQFSGDQNQRLRFPVL